MAQANSSDEKKVNPVPHVGDHDRVVMLSLKADGTTDQHNPEIIGDKEFAVQAARRQFAEQSVSAVDVAERGASSGGVTLVGQPDGSVKEVPANSEPDDYIKGLKEKHDAAASASEKAAERTINDLSA